MAELKRIPLFVLPTVLLPGGQLPLHVFEPRYRQMVARCLEYDKRFGLLFHRDDLYGEVRIEPGRIGCIAEIGSFQPLPDGRSLMLTEGVERFRIEEVVDSDTRYTEALVDAYEDEAQSEAELAERRQVSIDLFHALLRTLPEPPVKVPGFDPRRETSFTIAATIEIDPAWQQGLLELRSETARLDRIDELLRRVLDSRLGMSEFQ